MDEGFKELPIFNLDSQEDVLAVFQELEVELALIWKRIYRKLVDFWDGLGDKLWTRVKTLGHMLESAFTVDSLEDYYEASAIYGQALAGELYALSGSFTGLKNAVVQAVAPIAQLLVPVIRTALDAVTGFVQSIHYAVQALFLGGEASDRYTASLQTSVSAGKALQRSLAGFDQLNRLNKNQSSGSGITIPTIKPLTGAWKDFADKVVEFLKPLQKIDLSPLAKSLEKLKKALEPITKALFEALEWAWYNIFVPMAQWAAEELLPAFLDTLTAALEALGRVIEELRPAFLWLWENYLQPLAQWKADEIIRYLQSLTAELNGTGDSILGTQSIVDRMTQSGNTLINTIAQMAQKYLGLSNAGVVLEESFSQLLSRFIWAQTPFGDTDSALGRLGISILGLADNFGFLSDSSDSAWENLQSVWSGAWAYLKEKTMDPAYNGFRESANGMISIINGVLRGVTYGTNKVTGALNNISFKLPEWVPVLGGKGLSFSFPRLETPQIPMLAKGAVLPANQPFLAVVGDQRHGTNVEAPLATIQQAVAEVMEDYVSANLAGHQATVEVLQELLSAVLGIQIGDETIANAVARHDRKMAVVYGGAV